MREDSAGLYLETLPMSLFATSGEVTLTVGMSMTMGEKVADTQKMVLRYL